MLSIEAFRTPVFADLASDPQQLGQVVDFFEYCITESFKTDRPKMQHVTQDEVKRRFGIVAKVFQQLRGDCGWGLERIFEHGPRYVRAELDGDAWTPEVQTFWMPNT